ncbi:hypothetical protein [Aeromicrobium endophyticum]|uniref:Uncharacterized protein n=1 Tax=Aeromicrobium endophyticum TaxID=2292704 RepID=A0A371PD93_9ACTN|nr:hypothetical protein [Aeromicrobium endophyticum]REK73909.1 hypothetical protein DX116_10460 [Aeromicrobium endophyticum]
MTSRRPSRCTRDDRDERGAVFVFSVLIMSVLMIVAAFVIDLGVDRVVTVDMRSLADTTAMDMSTMIDGSKTTDQLKASSGSTLAATLARNRPSVAATVKDSDVVVTFGMASAQGDWLRAAGGAEYPNAVKVSVSGASSIRLWPGHDPAKPRRTAIAARQPRAACVTVGSYLAALDTSAGGGPLATLLNEVAPTSATVFTSAGLLAIKSISVPLADLVAELGVGDPSSPLTADVTLGSLARASARVLAKQPGSAASSAAVELNRIAGVAGTAGINETIKLGELVQLGVGNSAAVLSGDVNVFDLVAGSVMAFDGAHVVKLKDVGVTVPGFAVTSLNVTIVGPPKTVCGGAGSEVTSTQASVVAELTVLGADKYVKCGGVIGGLLCGVVSGLTDILTGQWKPSGTADVKVKLVLNGVNATVKVGAVGSCEPAPDVDVTATTTATNGSLTVEALDGLLSLPVVLPQTNASTASHTFTTSPSTWTNVGGLSTELISPISVAGAVVNGTTAVILKVAGLGLGPQLTTGLNSALSGMGLSLNGASVTLDKMSTCSVFGLRK